MKVRIFTLVLLGLNLGVALATKHQIPHPVVAHLPVISAGLLAGAVVYILRNWGPKNGK